MVAEGFYVPLSLASRGIIGGVRGEDGCSGGAGEARSDRADLEQSFSLKAFVFKWKASQMGIIRLGSCV